MGDKKEGTRTMSPGHNPYLDPEIDRDPDILIIRLAFAFIQFGKLRRNEREARYRLSRVQEESRILAEDRARLKRLEDELSTAMTETRELRMKADVAAAKLVDLESLREENRQLHEQARHHAETEKALTLTQTEVRELRLKLQSADVRLTDAERLADENRSLRQEVAELREQGKAALDLEKLSAEIKKLRVDNEQMLRRTADAERDRDELFDLRLRNAELSIIAQEATELRDLGQSLEAQLYAAGIVPRTRSTLPEPIAAEAGTIVHDFETSLQSLVGPEDARCAVLADYQGLLVAGAGDPIPQEGLAAFSGITSEFGARVKTFLPLSSLKAIRMTDINGTVVACRLFDFNEMQYGLATIANHETGADRTERVAGEIVSAMTADANGIFTPPIKSPSGS
jgi:hypothetical protein